MKNYLKCMIVLLVLFGLSGQVFALNENQSNQPEITDRRDAHTKQYLNPDGSITAVIYQAPVHYLKENKWMEINPNILKKAGVDYDYAMTDNNFQLYFSRSSDRPHKFAVGDGWISFQPLNSKSTYGEVNGKRAFYSRIWENVDLEFLSGNTGLKENIILNNPATQREFQFRINLHNLDYELTQNGQILFKDKNGTIQAMIPVGEMEDVSGEYSRQVQYRIDSSGKGNFILTVIPDSGWLNDKTRQYPVIIDPTITYPQPSVQDTYVTSYYQSSNMGDSTRLEIGENKPLLSNWVLQYTLLKFDLSAIPIDATIRNAYATLYLYDEYGDSPVTIESRKVTGSWTETGVMWSNRPNQSSTVYSTTTVDGIANCLFGVDPNWVKDWISSPSTNYGMYLTHQGAEVKNLKRFRSKEYGTDGPRLTVTFEGAAGLENYWTYRTWNLGNAGQASVNVFSSNLVYSNSDFFVPAKGFALCLTRVYNSIKRSTDDGYGYGWTINGNSYIKLLDGGNYVCLVHGDGSEHVFKKNTYGYTAPQGIDLSLSVVNGDYVFTNSNKEKFTYRGTTLKLQRAEDRYGNWIYFNYDASGRLNEISDNSMDIRKILLFYSNGRLEHIEGPLGKKAYYTYDAAGNLSTFKDFGGHIINYKYDTSRRLIYVSDNTDNTTAFTYASLSGNGIETVTTRDQYVLGSAAKKTIFKQIGITLPDCRTEVTLPTGGKITYTFNADGLVNKEEVQGATAAETTTYTYQYQDRLVNLESNGLCQNVYEYTTSNSDKIPDLTRVVVDNTGGKYETVYEYDANHNMVSVIDPRKKKTTYQWSPDGKYLLKVIDALAHETTYSYYSDGKIKTATTSPENGVYVTKEFYFDRFGYPDYCKIPLNDTETAVYDYEYDALGNLLSETGPDDVKISYTYNDCGLLTSVSNPNYPTDYSKWVSYQYDGNDNLQYVNYSNSLGRQTIEYIYTPGSQIQEIKEQNYSEKYIYDEMGRLLQVTSPNNSWVKYQYDVKGQLINVTNSDNAGISYTYDKYGNCSSMTDERGKIIYSYDHLNRVTGISEPNSTTSYTRYSYDENGNLKSLTLPIGGTVNYTYTDVNKLYTVTDPYTNLATTYIYNNTGQVKSVLYPNGTGEYYGFDKAGRITGVQYGNGTYYNYVYYPNNNVLSTTKTSNNENYTINYEYDLLGELTQYEQTASNGITTRRETFNYDSFGNRTIWIKNGVKTEYTYDNRNLLQNTYQTFNGRQAISESFTYDNNGNMTKGPGNITYAYNAFGMLKSAATIDGTTCSYFYDGNYKRYRQNINGQQTDYHYDLNWRTLYETDGLGTVTKNYINGLRTIGTKQNGVIEYNYHDSHGSTVNTRTDTQINNFSYGPFGTDEYIVDDFSYGGTDVPQNHGWSIYTSDYRGTLDTVYDTTLQNQVLKVQSASGLSFGIAWGFPASNLYITKTGLSVKYLNNQKLSIYVKVKAKNGSEYYLTYLAGEIGQPGVSGGYYTIPLNDNSGVWQLLERDLRVDLKVGFSQELDTIRWICIKGGDYYLDDLWFEGKGWSEDARKYADEDQDGTGLYYLRNRYYDPGLGRFISPDIYRGDLSQPLSLNRYIYCENNPIKYVDPSGNVLVADDLIIAGVAIGLAALYPVLVKMTNDFIDSLYDPAQSKTPDKEDDGEKSKLEKDIEKAGLPTSGEITFETDKRELTKNKDKNGYVDKDGNIWRQGPYHGDPKLGFTKEWDVELSQKGKNKWGKYLKKGKNYINVRPDGQISH